MLLLAVPPPVFADELSGELPESVRDILDEGGTDLSDAARWRFSDLCDTVGAWAAEGLQPTAPCGAVRRVSAAGGAAGLLAGDPYRAYVEILAVLGFGTLSLSAAMQLTELVAATAAGLPHLSDCLCAGVQRPGRHRRADIGGACLQRHVFAMSGFLSAVIQKLLLPVMQLYFCFAVSACLWDNPGMGMPPRCFPAACTGCSKGCGRCSALCWGCKAHWRPRRTVRPCEPARDYCRVSFPLSGTPRRQR